MEKKIASLWALFLLVISMIAYIPLVTHASSDYVCYNHYPYLVFSSQAELDSHVTSVHGGWIEYNVRFAFGLHKWNVFDKVGQVFRDLFILGDELGNERIPAQPQIGPYEGFSTWYGEAYVTNPYPDKIVALVGFNQYGDHMQTVWLSPKGTPGDSQWFDDINKWVVELHFVPIGIGSIKITVKNYDGTALTPETLILYDQNWNEITRANPTSNVYTFSNLAEGTYNVESYVDDMFIGSMENIQVEADQITEKTIQTQWSRRTLTITVFYGDGSTRFLGATTNVYSWDGYNGKWNHRQTGTTDNHGQVSVPLWPTTILGEKYKVEVVHDSQVVGSDDNVFVDKNTGGSIDITTTVPPLPSTGSIRIVVKYYDKTALTPETLILCNQNWQEVTRASPLSNVYIFYNLDVGTYHAEAYFDDMFAGSAENILVVAGETTDSTIQTQWSKSSLDVTVFYDDGITHFEEAKVNIYTWDGYNSRWNHRYQGMTDNNGQVSFVLWPTTRSSEKYKVEVIYGGQLVGSKEPVSVDKDTIASIFVTTSVSAAAPIAPMFKISNIFAPSSVHVNQEFYITVITSYSFDLETNVYVDIWNYGNRKQVVVMNNVLSGEGVDGYNFKFTAPNSVGTWRLLINASFEQNGALTQDDIGSEYHVSINIIEGEVPVAHFRVTPLYFNVEYDGETYKAFLTENLTAREVAPSYEDTDAFYNWMYSRFNWYILDSSDNLVTDELIYIEAAFAAHIALEGISGWLPHNLRVRSEQFEEVKVWGIRAEICKKVGTLAAGMIPSVLIGGVPTITKEIVSQTLAEGIGKGFTDPETLFTFFIANMLDIAAEKLESAAGYIEPVYDTVLEKGFPEGISVGYSDIVEFYYNVTIGKIYGYSAMKVLSEKFNEGIWNGFLIPVLKSAVEGTLPNIVGEIDSLIENSVEFKHFWEEVEKEEKFYDMRENTFKEYARKFFEVFNEGEAFVTIVGTQTPSGEEVNLLVSTNSTILSKYVSTKEKSIIIEVEGPEASAGSLSISFSKDFLTSAASTVEKILVTVDGKISPFVVDEQAETYIIYVNYSHSRRIVKICYVSYPLEVNVVGAIGQPLSGSKVLLLWSDGDPFDVQTTDANGHAYFNKVPLDNFTIKVEYKGFFVLQSISLHEPEEARISVDIVFEVLGFTFTRLNFILLVVLLVTVVTFVLTIVTIKRRKRRLSISSQQSILELMKQ